MIRLIKTYRTKILILGDQAIVSGVNFLLGIFIVRFFGLDIFGDFALVLMVTTGLLAINQALVMIPMQTIFAKKSFTTYIKKVKGVQLGFVISLVIVFIIAERLITIYIPSISHYTEYVYLLYAIALLLFDFNRKHLYIEKKYLWCLIKDCLSMISQIIVLFIVFQMDSSIELPSLLLLLSSCFLLVEVPVFFFFRIVNSPSKNILIEHWVFGKWILGNAVLQWFSGNFFIVIGVAVIGPQLAGIIRIGQSIIGVWNVLLQAMENYIPPAIATIYKEEGWEALSRYLKRLTFRGGVLILLIGILLILFRNQLWHLIYGDGLIEYSYILFWFSPILFFNFLGFPFRFALRTLQQTRVLFESYILSVLVGFLFANVLVETFNIHGVCFGLLISQIIMQIWYSIRLTKIIGHENSTYSIG